MSLIKPPFQQGRLSETEQVLGWAASEKLHQEREEGRRLFAMTADGKRMFVALCASEETAQFIMTACNAYNDLLTVKTQLESQQTVMAAQLADLKAELDQDRNGWESATEALRQADAAMDQVETVQVKMVAALIALDDVGALSEDIGGEEAAEAQKMAREALAAAQALADQ